MMTAKTTKSKQVELIPDKNLPMIKEPALRGAAVILADTAKAIAREKDFDPKKLQMAITVIDFYHKVNVKPVANLTASLIFCMREVL